MIRSFASDAIRMARLARELPAFLRTPLSLQQARSEIKLRLEQREQRFLALARDAIYSDPTSPYLKLLRSAGCEQGDLEKLVTSEGLEGALGRLADKGVGVAFEEFKGYSDAIRGSDRFTFAESDFDNPLVDARIVMRSGGTRSAGTTVPIGLPYIGDMSGNTAVALSANGLEDYDHAIWMFSTGLMLSIRLAKLGRSPLAWFYPVDSRTWKLRAGAKWMRFLGARAGHRLPPPDFVDLQNPLRMARWLRDQLHEKRKVCLTCYASSAARVSTAAVNDGIELEGACFITIGEPYTSAKRQAIEKSGARGVDHFGMTEAGLIGFSCPNATAPDDVHFFRDTYGLIQRPRAVSVDGAEIDAFLITTLLRSAPKIMLNTDTGDYGQVDRRACGCDLESIGLCDHISDIRSFEKLTSEGMTFVKSNLTRILEEALPARFGGASSDYQVVEQEGADGYQELTLLIAPEVGPLDEQQAAKAFLDELQSEGGYQRMGASIWRQLETVKVRRRNPVATKAGKILPYHLTDHIRFREDRE